jgi:DNA polymerase-3 subunit gamma/tau
MTKEKEKDIALYRKYRPQSFKDVVGQDHIVKVLEGAIGNKNVAHAYLFCGSRGTGKTSVARILSRAIGCTASDLVEIDAASYTGVDNIRELNETINTLPFESPYKVYIFDEVHMLSKGAFNALLKTLEEPPKHVIFILATTELEKVPETVVSRCQTFIFRKPTQKILKDMVLEVAKKEGFSLEPASADLIAFLGDGSFRDTQGILQKIIGSSSDKKISIAEVLLVTGAPRAEMVNNFISSIQTKNAELGLNAIDEAVEANINMQVYLKMILQKLRAILLLRLMPKKEGELVEKFSEKDFAFLKDLAQKTDNVISSRTLVELLNAYDEVNKSSLPEMILELVLIRLTTKE